MSIRSVDMMILYSKTADVEKLAQQHQQQPAVAQQQLAEEAALKKEILKAQVQQAPAPAAPETLVTMKRPIGKTRNSGRTRAGVLTSESELI